MRNYLIFFFVILFIVLLKTFLERYRNLNNFPYSQKDRFLTMSEKKFFLMLTQWFRNEYHVFPQIHLSSLFSINDSEKRKYSYLNKIDRKSVDFVLFEKESMLPVIAIELDDYTHRFARRMKRDSFIDKVFEAARLPIIHVSNFDNQEFKIKEEIELLINERKFNSQKPAKIETN